MTNRHQRDVFRLPQRDPPFDPRSIMGDGPDQAARTRRPRPGGPTKRPDQAARTKRAGPGGPDQAARTRRARTKRARTTKMAEAGGRARPSFGLLLGLTLTFVPRRGGTRVLPSVLGWGMSDEPLVRDMPVGIGASGHRRESDSMGVVHVPADRYWGAQTERSLLHFGDIGADPMPLAVYHAFGHVKKAAALANGSPGGCLPGWPR